MQDYGKILAALELKEAEKFLIDKVKELSKPESNVWLVHVVESLGNYGATYGAAVGLDIDNILHQEAKEKLDLVEKQLGLKETKKIIKHGLSSKVILEEAAKIQADLIILGSHGHRGIKRLLGSTANEVIHAAACDVLAVRVPH